MIEHLKHIWNKGWKRDNIKTTFEKNVDNYIKTEDIKGNLEIGHIRRHFSRPSNKEIELYSWHIISSQEERKLYYDELKNIYKLHIEGRSWLKIEEPVIWLNDINTGYKEKEMLNDPKVSEVMWNIKHGRIYTDTLWVIGKNKRFGENVEIKEIVNKLLEIETRNRGISSMYIPKQKPTNIEPISTNINPEIINTEPKVIDSIEATNINIVSNIAGSDASRIGLPVEQNKSNVRTESTEESTETKVVEASVETEIKKDIEVSSVINIEKPSLQISSVDYHMLYGNHFFRLINKYNNFNEIPKKELYNVYKNLKLVETGIITFNNILNDGFTFIKKLGCKKEKEIFCMQNLAGILKNNNKTIEFVLFPNFVINVPLNDLVQLHNVIEDYKNMKKKMVLIWPSITEICNSKVLAKYFYNIKCVDGFYLKVDTLMSADVDNAVINIKSIFNIFEVYKVKFANDMLVFENIILKLTGKKFKLNLNNSVVFMALSHSSAKLQTCCNKFLEINVHYWDLLHNWVKMIKEVEKKKDKIILANQSSDKTKALHCENVEIINNVTVYDAFANKTVYFKFISELPKSYTDVCQIFYINISKVSKIVKELKEFIDSGGSGDL